MILTNNPLVKTCMEGRYAVQFFEDLTLREVLVKARDMYLTKFARKVTVIHRRDELRAAKSIQEKAFANPKMNFLWDTVVDEADGDEILSKIIVRNTKTGELTTIEADEEDGMFGLFGFIGLLPNTKLFEGLLDMKVNDIIEKCEKDLSWENLVDLVANHNRQVDLLFAEKQTDEDGYLSWDAENWTSVDGKRFIRSYSLEGRTLSDYSGYNKYDMKGYFKPEMAKEVRLN